MGEQRESAQELLERLLAERRAQTPQVTLTDGFEEEPILKTGAQLARERKAREAKRTQTRTEYVEAAHSAEDAAWRHLMAYGTPDARVSAGGEGDGAGEKTARRGDSFAARRMRDEMDDAPCFGASGRSDAGPSAGFGLDDELDDLPIWRRPARQKPVADASLFGAGDAVFAEPPDNRPTCELPPLLQELRAMERDDEAFLKTRDWLFVHQAKLAADYEDDFAYEGTFQHYFPTYQAMDDCQLRGYFAWRTRVRRGEIVRTSLSFAFVYVYELLNGVGVGSPAEGYTRLRDFARAYRAEDVRIERYVRTWLHDYVIFHGLDRALLSEGEANETPAHVLPSVDDALCALLAAGEERAIANGVPDETDRAQSEERLFTALCALSSYRLDSSPFYREEPQLTRRAACETWRALSAYCRKHRKRTLFEGLFGARTAMPYPMFRSAVFFGETRHADAVYEVNGVRRFVCKNGRWSEEAFHEARGRNKDLGRILKAVDRTLRQRCGSKRQLKAELLPKYVQGIVENAVDGVLERRQREEERARASHIEIDLSKLQGIRAAAAVTREALLTDEERDDTFDGAVPNVTEGGAFVADVPLLGKPVTAAPERPANSPVSGLEVPTPAVSGPVPVERVADVPDAADNPAGLTPDELAYVCCLLDDLSDAARAAVLKRAGTLESLMVDAVNEKLYDLLGDIAIEDAGEGFAVIEDYSEDLREIVG